MNVQRAPPLVFFNFSVDPTQYMKVQGTPPLGFFHSGPRLRSLNTIKGRLA